LKFAILQKPKSTEVAVFVSSPPEKEREMLVEWLRLHSPALLSGSEVCEEAGR
jgi:hypothetical protein